MEQQILEKLKKIIEYENKITELSEERSARISDIFVAKPKAPVCGKINREYPPVVSSMKPDYKKWVLQLIIAMLVCSVLEMFFDSIFIMLLLIFVLVMAYYNLFHKRFIRFPKEKKAEEERIRNSDEYKEECRKLDEEYDRRQAEMNQTYNSEMEKYNNNLATWNALRENTIKTFDSKIKEIEVLRDSLYKEVEFIPIDYRKKETVEYIYHVVSSSNYTIKQAIELYNQKVQREIEQARLRELQYQNELERQRQYSEQQAQEYYDDFQEKGYSGGIIRGAATALEEIYSEKKELRRQNDMIKRQNDMIKKQAEYAEKRRQQEERERRHQAAVESQRQWRAVKEANDERRRKGQPELPLPPRTWD